MQTPRTSPSWASSSEPAPRLDHVEQPCGGQGGEALQRLGDECHVGVELRGATRALALALHPCLAQHPLDGGVVDAELGGDGPYPLVLDEVVAQDLRLELVVDRHRARRSVPGATPSASSYRRATPLPTDELADRARAEVAVHRDGRFGRHRRIGLAHRNSMRGEFSIARGASGTVMRHFVRARAFAAPAPVAPLALGMTVPAAPRVLIPASRPAQRFTPSEAAAARPAVVLAPVTARADEHLAPASGTEKQSGIVHCSPRWGGLDDPRSPGNTALGAVRKCGSGRSLGRDRQVSTVRGCVGLLADSHLTPTHERRHRRYARRAPPLAGSIGSGGETTTRPRRARWDDSALVRFDRHSQFTRAVRQMPAHFHSHQHSGYQALKKWLSYRELPILGRPLRPKEIQDFTDTARRIAAILLLCRT